VGHSAAAAAGNVPTVCVQGGERAGLRQACHVWQGCQALLWGWAVGHLLPAWLLLTQTAVPPRCAALPLPLLPAVPAQLAAV
jgi:hypothetical protein